MSVKLLLYIDDNKIDSQIEKLRRKLRSQGFELKETFLHLDDRFKVRDKTTKKIILSKTKIQEYLTTYLLDTNFDIVASDYDFNDEQLDGFELLRWIKNESNSKKHRIRRAKFCLYSAEQDKIAKSFNTPEQVKKLIKLKIDDFIDREKMTEEITQMFISTQKSYYFKEHLVNYLEKHGDKVFKSVYPKFKGKKLEDIAHEIDKDLPNGIEFQRSLVELTVAHLIDLNKSTEE